MIVATGIENYDDLYDRFDKGLRRVVASDSGFVDTFLSRLPLVLTDDIVATLADEYGWSEDFLRPPSLSLAKAPASHDLRMFATPQQAAPQPVRLPTPPLPAVPARRVSRGNGNGPAAKSAPPRPAVEMAKSSPPPAPPVVAETAALPAPAQDDPVCAICQQSLGAEVVHTMTCGHPFHRDCVQTWLEVSREVEVRCPICRTTQPAMSLPGVDRVEDGSNEADPSHEQGDSVRGDDGAVPPSEVPAEEEAEPSFLWNHQLPCESIERFDQLSHCCCGVVNLDFSHCCLFCEKYNMKFFNFWASRASAWKPVNFDLKLTQGC